MSPIWAGMRQGGLLFQKARLAPAPPHHPPGSSVPPAGTENRLLSGWGDKMGAWWGGSRSGETLGEVLSADSRDNPILHGGNSLKEI